MKLANLLFDVVLSFSLFLHTKAAPANRDSTPWFETFKEEFNEEFFEKWQEDYAPSKNWISYTPSMNSNALSSTFATFFTFKHSRIETNDLNNIKYQSFFNTLQESKKLINETNELENQEIGLFSVLSNPLDQLIETLKTLFESCGEVIPDAESQMLLTSFVTHMTKEIRFFNLEISSTDSLPNKLKLHKKIVSRLEYLTSLVKSISTISPSDILNLDYLQSEFIQYNKKDEEFLGKFVGMMLCKDIEGSMEAGDVTIASKQLILILNDIVTYLGFVGVAIGLCINFGMLNPALCAVSFASVGIATLALILRAYKKMNTSLP